jgi:hypothetical protein
MVWIVTKYFAKQLRTLWRWMLPVSKSILNLCRGTLYIPFQRSRSLQPTCSLINYLILTFYSLAVSPRITRFKIQKFYMLLALRWWFCTDLRTERTSALYKFNWSVFITVVVSVYSAVRTDSLYKAEYASSLKINFSFHAIQLVQLMIVFK